MNIKFDEEPKYAAYRDLFEPLCGQAGPSRPILTETVARAGSKRQREALEDETEDGGAPKKKVDGVLLYLRSLSTASCQHYMMNLSSLMHMLICLTGPSGTPGDAVDYCVQRSSANEATLPLQCGQHSC